MGPGPDARARLQGPAIGLLVTGILGILAQLISLIVRLFSAGLGAVAAANGEDGGIAMIASGVLGIVFGIIALLMGGLVIFGSMKMKNAQSYGLCMATAIIAALPCVSPCCLLGLPIGIWAIVVLVDPQVKAAFQG